MPTTVVTTFPRQFDTAEVDAILGQIDCQVRYLYPASTPTEEETISILAGVDALIAGSEPLTERVFQAAPTLRIIARTGIGVDSIDLDAAHRRGIAVTITPEANSVAVADLTMGLLLCLARRICTSDRAIRNGRWERQISADLAGKTLGIVGLGAVGKLVARRARAFDMRILASDPQENEVFAAACEVTYCEFDDLLAESDYVSLHLPLTRESQGLIDEARLRAMKPTAYLVNTSRGAVVDERALCRALSEGWIAGAGLDVFEAEPPWGSALLELDNVVLSPHAAGWTTDAWNAMACQAAQEVVRVLQGVPPLHPV